MSKEDRKPMKDANGKPTLDEDLIIRKEEDFKTTRNYWILLIKCDEFKKCRTSSTKDQKGPS